MYLLPLGVPGLIAARLVLGAGEGAVFTAGSAWIVDLAPPDAARPGDRPLRPRGLGWAQHRAAVRRADPARLRLHRRLALRRRRCRCSARLIATRVPDPFRPAAGPRGRAPRADRARGGPARPRPRPRLDRLRDGGRLRRPPPRRARRRPRGDRVRRLRDDGRADPADRRRPARPRRPAPGGDRSPPWSRRSAWRRWASPRACRWRWPAPWRWAPPSRCSTPRSR